MRWIAAILLLLQPYTLLCQQVTDKLIHLPASYLQKIDRTTARLNDQLTRKTEKYLQRLLRQEERLRRKMVKVDSTAAVLFEPSNQQYKTFIHNLHHDSLAATSGTGGEYLPYIDSLQGSLSFLLQNKTWLPAAQQLQIGNSHQQWQRLQANLQQSDVIKAYVRQRRDFIQQFLKKYSQLPPGIDREYRQLCKEVYYYQQQVQHYKDLLNDPAKWQQQALALLNRIPAFQAFMRNNSQLAGMFNLPAGYAGAQVAGLQDRDQVLQVLQNQLGSGGPNAQQVLQQGLQTAQPQLNQLKDKLLNAALANGDDNLPDFKPNHQRTRSFLQRLEYGSNLQTTRSGYFFPTTTDLALSVGYKLNDKSTIGIGASYKVGWGKDIRHIVITSEGAGIRSFLDLKLKGSFYASGGFEYNYQPLNMSFSLPTGRESRAEAWQQSGLLGVSKIVSLKSKLFKKTKLQLLWDFLSYQQVPRTQAIKFRVGYTF
jgi:hypothetical protein